MQNYVARIRLTGLIQSRVIDIENSDGILEKGVFIPLDMNGLHVTDRGNVNLYAFVTERMSVAKDESTHFFKLKVNKEDMKRINGYGYDLPYIGDMTPHDMNPKFQTNRMGDNRRVKFNENARYEDE